MHPLAAGNLATWLWQNRTDLGDAFTPIADRVEHALGSSRPEIQRIGSAIVSIRDDQTQVLGLLHQHNAQCARDRQRHDIERVE